MDESNLDGDSSIRCPDCPLRFETLLHWQRHNLDAHMLIPRRPKARLIPHL